MDARVILHASVLQCDVTYQVIIWIKNTFNNTNIECVTVMQANMQCRYKRNRTLWTECMHNTYILYIRTHMHALCCKCCTATAYQLRYSP